MTAFLFWNLKNKPLQEIISSIALSYDIDVFIFVEFSIDNYDLLEELDKNDLGEYFYAPGLCDKIHIFSRFNDDFIKPIYETHNLSIRRLSLPGLKDILIAITHFPSKRYWDEESQSVECIDLANSIRSVEIDVGHSRTILVGDFNMNPFETGLVSAAGLHAVMSRKIAERNKRTVQQKEYPFFYNPMWNFFGDSTMGPPGTYYYTTSTHKIFFWNIFDQLLVRPDLLNSFNNDDLMIITSTDNINLLNRNGFPNQKEYSDHLPIYFKLNI